MSNEWKKRCLSCEIMDDTLYAFGGMGDSAIFLNTIEKLDLRKKMKWIILKCQLWEGMVCCNACQISEN